MNVINFKKYFLPLIFIISFVVLSMFSDWEMGGESWGYWYFSEIFKKYGEFIIFDRSPIYVLYLTFFNWLNYPYSTYVEYLFTTSFCSYALFLFSRKFLNTAVSLIAACICIPFLQISEPPVQKLALALSLFALIVRYNGINRKLMMTSYALLLLAYCFRQTYLFLILIFLTFDLITFYKQRNIFNFKKLIPQINSDWPLITVLILFVYFILNQSTSNFNNVWMSDTTWLPSDGKKMKDGGGLQMLNAFYILKTYGSYVGQDIYITNKEAFNNANTYIGAIVANPKIFIQMLIYNIRIFIPILLTPVFEPTINIWIVKAFYKTLIFLTIFYGSFKFAVQKRITNFFIGSSILILLLLIAQPKERYLMPVIPIFIMASCYYADFFVKYLSFNNLNDKYFNRQKKLYSIYFLMFFSFLSFFNFEHWGMATKNMIKQLNKNNYEVLSNKSNFLLSKSFKTLKNVSINCKGLMSLENLFLGSFVNKDINYYSVFEIPPFGTLTNNNNLYNGLNQNRINCIFVSKQLDVAIGAGTNVELRYKNYIKPYVNQLIKNGAIKYIVPNYGTAYVLK